jgi:MoaA/NifB/PqqE/SkfB family radical SAM enzyme
MGTGSYTITQTMDPAALWAERHPLLRRLDVELTERCNNNCLHCYINRPADDRAARERELSTAQIQGILDEAAALGALSVRFTGGEPLLRGDFEALYLHARRLGLKVTLSTNATLVSPHLADLLARIPPLEAVDVTVYGLTADSYEAVSRAPGSFARFWRGVNLLLERGVPLRPKFAPLPPNAHELDDFESWALSLPGVDRPPGNVLFLDQRARREVERSRELVALRRSPAEGMAVLARRGEAYLAEMRAFCARFTRPPGDRLFACGAGRESACLDAYGYLQPCVQLRHPDTVYNLALPPSPISRATAGRVARKRSGSVAEGVSRPREADPVKPLGLDTLPTVATRPALDVIGGLEEALTEFFPRMRQMRATHLDYLARCARCFLKGLCDQCPAKSWMEHGTLDTPVEYLCAVAHAKARHLGLLAEGENAWQVRDWQERIDRFSTGVTSAG